MHSSLKENHRIDLILQAPGCQVLNIKFFNDKMRVVISFANGLVAIFNTLKNIFEMVLPVGSAVIDTIKV